MNFKKRVNGSWTDTSHYIHNTSTDAITTLPTVIYPTDTMATVGLKGQTIQSSTPSPTSPVMPQGTGNKTANLFDKTTLENGIYLAANGNKYGNITNGVRAGVKIKALPNTAYTLSVQSSANVSLRIFEWGNGTFIKQTPKYNISGNISLTVTTDAETTEIAFNIEGVNTQYATSIMLNSGSTPLPYEPYGYKIPILSNSTTTPVYLGEVESTRKVKKYVFTGEENGTIYSTGTSRKGIEIIGITGIIGGNADIAILAICTHYQPNMRNALYRNTDNGISNAYQNDRIIFYDASCQTVESFQQFCAQQYAAGTPVCVWYVLASETTGIVNEPLMKIGDYADTVSGISIPTTAGANSFDVLTTLKPSEVTATYKGWHPVADVHERDNGAWT